MKLRERPVSPRKAATTVSANKQSADAYKTALQQSTASVFNDNSSDSDFDEITNQENLKNSLNPLGTPKHLNKPVGVHDHYSGQDLYAFNASPQVQHVVRTPKSQRRLQVKKVLSTKKESATRSCSTSTETTTPRSLRRSIRNKLEKLRNDGVNHSDSETESSESNEEDADPIRIRHDADWYFTQQGKTKSATSNHTLAKLGELLLSAEDITTTLQKEKDPHKVEMQRLADKHFNSFPEWYDFLEADFNLLLYGVGSKIKVLKKFEEFLLSHCKVCLVVLGFHSNFTLAELVTTLCEAAEIDRPTGVGSVASQLQTIGSEISNKARHIYLLINNIDGPALRSSQNVFAQLASCDCVHIVASVDHINAPLMWDQILVRKFNWIWINALTYEPYGVECATQQLHCNSSSTTLSSMEHVFASLTSNAKKIFLLIAENQLNSEDPCFQGIPFQELYKRCRAQFLVNSDLTLRTQLTEFFDHRMIRLKKGVDGAEYVYVTVDKQALEVFMERENATD